MRCEGLMGIHRLLFLVKGLVARLLEICTLAEELVRRIADLCEEKHLFKTKALVKEYRI